ncbi:hypothetical protein BD310DRAFT_300171 [Dichomitus squalens]|uniref:Uncharacterized protein n=1 Tax=Dichomitus squalens TaxID=114155 RepID=A0A4V2K9T3_9APHY|nr:hypothetical protein BD310DRAFT_300171 [Dichomitus squalens]
MYVSLVAAVAGESGGRNGHGRDRWSGVVFSVAGIHLLARWHGQPQPRNIRPVTRPRAGRSSPTTGTVVFDRLRHTRTERRSTPCRQLDKTALGTRSARQNACGQISLVADCTKSTLTSDSGSASGPAPIRRQPRCSRALIRRERRVLGAAMTYERELHSRARCTGQSNNPLPSSHT